MSGFDVGYGDREVYTPWFIEITRPDGTTFVMNAKHTYRYPNLVSVPRPEDYRQDFGPNRRSPSGSVN